SSPYVSENPTSIFVPRVVFTEIGFFDSVRVAADSEFIWRIRQHFGMKRVAELAKPLAIGLHHKRSITHNGPGAFDENRHSLVRQQYWEAWADWHRRAAADPVHGLFVPFPQSRRKFAAPQALLDGAT